MEFEDYFPVWASLSDAQRKLLKKSVQRKSAGAGELLHNGFADCVGLFVIKSGQLRTYINSDEGKEITLYRLFERDICLLSAPCMISSIQFDVNIEAEKESELWVIPADVYAGLMAESAAAANYTSQLMASRLSEVMQLIEQVMWMGFDKRLADFLLNESMLEETDVLKITHEKLANHLGTAREVVTRTLKRFKAEGLVELNRGSIEIKNRGRLENI